MNPLYQFLNELCNGSFSLLVTIGYEVITPEHLNSLPAILGGVTDWFQSQFLEKPGSTFILGILAFFKTFAMSSNNALSTVTYTSISSDSNGPSSWGIPLESASQILDMEPSMEVPLLLHEPEHPRASSCQMMLISQAEDQPDAIVFTDCWEPNEEHEPEKEDAKEDESSENSDETEPFKENETAATPPPPRSPQNRTLFSQTRLCRARKTVRLEPPMSASIEARICCALSSVLLLLRALEGLLILLVLLQGRTSWIRFSCLVMMLMGTIDVMTSMEDSQFEGVLPWHRICLGQESEIFYTQLHDAWTDRRDIGSRLCSDERLKTLDVISHESIWSSGQRQRAKDDVVMTDHMRTQLKDELMLGRRDVAKLKRHHSFDVIIGMDWLTKYHGVIICDEKIAQGYLSRGCDVFLAHITTKEAKDESEGKRLEDVPIVRDFPEVFPEGRLVRAFIHQPDK
ncbi:hypothetical protein Tco_0420877 [Tanacetum coccineum]